MNQNNTSTKENMNKNYDDYPTIAVAQPIDVPSSKKSAGPSTLPKITNSRIQEKQLSRLLEQGYTRGFADSLNKTKQEFAQRVSSQFYHVVATLCGPVYL